MRVGGSGGGPVVDPGEGCGDTAGGAATMAGKLDVGNVEWA